MNYNRAGFTGYILAIVLAVCSFRCDESLPEYVAPTNVLAVNVTLVEQLPDRIARPGKQMVHIRLVGENVFDEVFQDEVNMRGSLRIWWNRKPTRFRTMYLTEKNLCDRSIISNGRMTMFPGQRFAMDVYWNMKSDDSVYLPREMTYVSGDLQTCGANLLCSNPEEFTIEATLNVFDRIGPVPAPPKDFIFIGKYCFERGPPPCTRN